MYVVLICPSDSVKFVQAHSQLKGKEKKRTTQRIIILSLIRIMPPTELCVKRLNAFWIRMLMKLLSLVKVFLLPNSIHIRNRGIRSYRCHSSAQHFAIGRQAALDIDVLIQKRTVIE